MAPISPGVTTQVLTMAHKAPYDLGPSLSSQPPPPLVPSLTAHTPYLIAVCPVQRARSHLTPSHLLFPSLNAFSLETYMVQLFTQMSPSLIILFKISTPPQSALNIPLFCLFLSIVFIAPSTLCILLLSWHLLTSTTHIHHLPPYS